MALDLIRELNKAYNLEKIDFDIMHLHASAVSPRLFNYIDQKLGHNLLKEIGAWRFNKKPVVVTFHSLPSHTSLKKKQPPYPSGASKIMNAWKGIEKKYCVKSASVICVDRYMVEDLRKISGCKNVVHVPSGVDSELNRPLNRDEAFNHLPLELQNTIGKETLRILYVGRLEVDKGVYILNALSDVLPENSKLIVAGHGNLKLLKKSPRTTYIGPLKNENIPNLINCCDVIFNTSVVEGIGRQTFEAMACGKPVVMLDYGDRYPLVHGENGFLVQDVAGALRVIKELKNNAWLYERISKNALETARKFSVQNMAKKVDEIYEHTYKIYN